MKLFEVLNEQDTVAFNLDRNERRAAARDKTLRRAVRDLPPGERHKFTSDPSEKRKAVRQANQQQKEIRQQSHQEKQQQAQYKTLQQQTAAVFGPTITSQNIMEVLPQLFSKFRTNKSVVSEIFNAMSLVTKKDRDLEFKQDPVAAVAKDIKRKLSGEQIRDLKKKLSEDQATTPQATPEMIRFKAKEVQQAFADLDIHKQRLLYTKLQRVIQGDAATRPSLAGIPQRDIKAAERGHKVAKATGMDAVGRGVAALWNKRKKRTGQ